MDTPKNNTFKIVAIILAILLIVLFIASIFIRQQLQRNNRDTSQQASPIPTFTQISIQPVETLAYSIPTLKPQDGKGVNINSPEIQKSQQLINVLKPSLPYEKELKTSNGLDLSISIPQSEFQDTPWTLDVYVYGVDYQIPSTDPQYAVQKEAFREAANDTFSWMTTKGIDPQFVIINWGDKEFIRNRANEWLK